MTEFKDFNMSPQLLKAITGMGFKEPTKIQEESIPHILAGEDVIGESATGSGKTVAFGCAAIEHTDPKGGLQTLILTPTRELAEQVKGVIQELAFNKKLRVLSIYGGVNINPQIDNLPKTHIVVATPGRLLDHLERRTIDLSKIKVFILDEADRMFDMGFIDDVKRIMNKCPRKKQNLFFSATISSRIQGLANQFMANPIKISGTAQVDPAKLEQVYYDLERNQKLSLLVHLLQQDKSGLVMIFCNTRRTTDFLHKNLKANKIKSIAIHGGLAQNKRARTIELFNNGKVHVLVCTDVAARGLHIDNVSHVYNYEIPNDATSYVHRIGRTARAGEEGKVINLICSFDHEGFGKIKHEYRKYKINHIKIPEFKKIFAIKADERRDSFGGRSGGYNRGGSSRGSGGYGRGRSSGGYGGGRDSESRDRTPRGYGRSSRGGRGSSRGGYGDRSSSGGSSKGGYGGRSSGRSGGYSRGGSSRSNSGSR